MATILKVAKSAGELSDVFTLRHDVYVVEEGKFGGQPFPASRLTDKFDDFPGTVNIIAYHDGEPAGTIRVTLDTGNGLPPDELFSFKDYRQQQADIWRRDKGAPVVFASAGMLAINKKSRHRRDVIQALLKMATGVISGWGATHLIAISNHEATMIYERQGFEALAEKFWVEDIGNFVVPMATIFSRTYAWAFANLLDSNLDTFWLDNFARHFERVLIGPDDVLFGEGDPGREAYILDSGLISIRRRDASGQELTLATLSRGALFGELALLDDGPRSAMAIANTNVELIRLDKLAFEGVLGEVSPLVRKLFHVFTGRIRRTDDLAMVMAFAPHADRIRFALTDLQRSAVPDQRHPGKTIVKVGPRALAISAGVYEHEVRKVLEEERVAGRLEYNDQRIRFFGNA